MKGLLMVFVILLVMVGCGEKATTPESVVRAFYTAMNNADGEAVAKLVTTDSLPQALIGMAIWKSMEVKATVNKVDLGYVEETAWVVVSLSSDIRGTKSSETETYWLIKEGGQWRIDLTKDD